MVDTLVGLSVTDNRLGRLETNGFKHETYNVVEEKIFQEEEVVDV